MSVSVIISTYNSPTWLEKVLWGYSVQQYKDFDIIIADDGSTIETAELIQRMKQDTGLDIKHIWQSDKGFRKPRILNKATITTESDYIIYTDGDCIPRFDFVQVHVDEARPGHYLSGGYHKLPISTSQAIKKDHILEGHCFQLAWLRSHGLNSSYKNIKLVASRRWARILNTITPTKCNFKGSNASAWRSDIMKINGFDETMGWGGEDREFGVRLVNSGIIPRHVRYNAVVIHLEHPRSYRDNEIVKKNKLHRMEIEKNRIIRTEHGIEQLIESGFNQKK